MTIENKEQAAYEAGQRLGKQLTDAFESLAKWILNQGIVESTAIVLDNEQKALPAPQQGSEES